MIERALKKTVVAAALATAIAAGAACGDVAPSYSTHKSQLTIPWGIVFGVLEAVGHAYLLYEVLNEEHLVLMTRDSFYWEINQLYECGERLPVNPVVMKSGDTVVAMNFEAKVVCAAEGEPRSKEEWREYLLEKLRKEKGQ